MATIEELGKRGDAIRYEEPGWVWYRNWETSKFIEENRIGKWLVYFSDIAYARKICEKAVLSGAVGWCKHSSELKLKGGGTGVICFYLNGDDVEGHKRVLRFLIENEMIRKRKSGALYNIAFKYDSQTYAGEYGSDFHAEIKLADFVNLETGELLA